MVEKDHVVAFVADMVPLTADAIGNYLDDAHVPAVGGDVSSPDWNEHQMLFPQGTGAFALYDNSVFLDAKFIHEAGGNRWGALYCAEDSVCPVWYQRANNQAPKAGLKPVYGAQVSLTQPSFTAQCLQAKNAGVQILELILDTNSIERVARDCAAQGYNPFLATGALTVQSDVAQDPNVKRIVSIVPTFPWTLASGSAAGEYQQAIKTYDSRLNRSAATSAAWTSAKLLEAALRGISATATVKPTDVVAGLYKLHDEKLGGLAPGLNFVRGRPAPVAKCYFGIRLSNGSWTPLNQGGAYC
jgi:branched-chain amino acid transport system substrate-binding protein